MMLVMALTLVACSKDDEPVRDNEVTVVLTYMDGQEMMKDANYTIMSLSPNGGTLKYQIKNNELRSITSNVAQIQLYYEAGKTPSGVLVDNDAFRITLEGNILTVVAKAVVPYFMMSRDLNLFFRRADGKEPVSCGCVQQSPIAMKDAEYVKVLDEESYANLFYGLLSKEDDVQLQKALSVLRGE